MRLEVFRDLLHIRWGEPFPDTVNLRAPGEEGRQIVRRREPVQTDVSGRVLQTEVVCSGWM